jgi:energy-coupling factor transporter transmembrane protein EcfT
MFRINIITQLLSFFIFAIVINQLNLNTLSLVLIIFIAILLINKTHQFLRSLKRFRWFFLVLIAIFAFNTPGEHLADWPFIISPTYEGITAGFTQTLRIVVMLAAISLILVFNTKQQLISGFYFIFSPLKKIFGLKVERFATRLWLTLHYVELQRENKSPHDFFNRLKAMTSIDSNQENEVVSIVFTVPRFSWVDYALIGFVVLLLTKFVVKAFV